MLDSTNPPIPQGHNSFPIPLVFSRKHPCDSNAFKSPMTGALSTRTARLRPLKMILPPGGAGTNADHDSLGRDSPQPAFVTKLRFEAQRGGWPAVPKGMEDAPG